MSGESVRFAVIICSAEYAKGHLCMCVMHNTWFLVLVGILQLLYQGM